MARLYNLARMTTATTGTGTLTLGSAADSGLTFAQSGVSNGETVTYAIEDYDVSGSVIAREIGRGVYTSSGTTLTRATILDSTNSGSAVNLSGLAKVFITAAAEDIPWEDVNVLRPEAFGAKGDNSTDDYAALQAMFDSVGNVGTVQVHRPTVVILRPGAIYRVGTTPKIQQYNVRVIGNWAGIRMTGTGPALMVDYAASVNSTIGVHIDAVALQSDPASSANHGLHVVNGPQCKITRIQVKDFSSDGTATAACGGAGIRVEASVAISIEDCIIDKPGTQGIYVKSATIGGSPAESQESFISRNRVYRSGSIGILVSEGGGHRIVNNDIELCAGGIEVRSSYDFDISHNYFEANTTDIAVRNTVDLVAARAVKGGRIIGNFCESTTGISLVNGDDIVVLANRISGNASIAAAMVRTVWGMQTEQTGALTDSASDTRYVHTRPITGTANEITVTNGNGASGAPTLSLPSAMTFTGKTVTGGTFSGVTVSGTTTLPSSSQLTSDGRLGLGGTPGSGQKLQVFGDWTLGGNGTFGAGSALRSSGAIYWDAGYPSGSGAHHFRQGAGLATYLRIEDTAAFPVDRGVTFENQTSAAGAATGTLTNAPAAGNPGYWLKIKIGATSYAIPCWAG